MTREVMEQALEALENAVRYHGIMLMADPPQDAWKYHKVEDNAKQAITAIKKALAQPPLPVQEPVACRFCHDARGCWTWQCYSCGEIDDVQQPAAQPVQEPLTHDEIEVIGDKVANEQLVGRVANFRVRFARAIEAAHNIKENT